MSEQTEPRRLRNGLPPSAKISDKCGKSATFNGRTAAFNDIALVEVPNGHTVVVAAILTDSPASNGEHDAIFTEIAQTLTRKLGGE
jgi:beta-lactamase class A